MTTLYTGNTIGFMHNGQFLTANDSHPEFTVIVDMVLNGQLEQAAERLDLKTAVKTAITGSSLTLQGNSLFFGKEEVRGILGTRIIEMLRLGFDVIPLELFIKNLMDNPSKRAVDELYGFLEVSQLPITDDGFFLAYKSVKQDFTDHHTGKMDNSIGATVEMPRNKVDEDKDRTCSTGLHFAAHEYASNFGSSGRLVVLKINPKDVVSIPSDYNNQKGRACKYEILREVDRHNKELVGATIVGKTAPKATPKAAPKVLAKRGPISIGDKVVMSAQGTEEWGSGMKNPANTVGTVIAYETAFSFTHRVDWGNDRINSYKKGDLSHAKVEQVESGDTPVTPAVTPKYVPQSDNYEDSSVWRGNDAGYGYNFIGDASEFPINRKTSYDLQRQSDGKFYEEYFLTAYDEKHDNLVFRKHNGEDFDYCTISDLSKWSVDTYTDQIVIGS